MKTVYLLRHAKSSWDQPSLTDFERPLARRGRKAAPSMGAFMARKGLVPDRVLCSAARRARETWELVAPALPDTTPVEVTDALYHAAPGDLLDSLHELPPGARSVLVLGHNPTLEDLALALVATGEARALQRLESKYPTGALAVIDFNASRWSEVVEGKGHLRAFIRPKDVE